MRPVATGYILKEYGSWSVLIVAFLAGAGVSRTFAWSLLPLLLSLAFLINSKQAFMKWLRNSADRKSLIVFVCHIAAAAVILLAIFREDVPRLLPLLVFPAAYLLTNKLAGEHFILTELLGFALLSVAAVLAKFLLTGGLDVRLFVCVALYFTAGVFKVKTLILKKTADRIAGVLYVLASAYIVHARMHVPLIVLLPLIDNLVVAVKPYRVKLKTVGWTEVAKSLVFLILLIVYY